MTAAPLLADRPLVPDPPPRVPGPGVPMPTPWPLNPQRPDYQPSCPTCGLPVASLLAGCDKPLCLTADLNEDARYDQ